MKDVFFNFPAEESVEIRGMLDASREEFDKILPIVLRHGHQPALYYVFSVRIVANNYSQDFELRNLVDFIILFG